MQGGGVNTQNLPRDDAAAGGLKRLAACLLWPEWRGGRARKRKRKRCMSKVYIWMGRGMLVIERGGTGEGGREEPNDEQVAS